MSRKIVPEQNDISLIIGNLPKRLQAKIAAKCNNCGTEDAESDDTMAATQAKPISLLRAPRSECINNEDRLSPVLATSGSTVQRLPKDSAVMMNSLNEVIIPGILRLNKAESPNFRTINNNNNKSNDNNNFKKPLNGTKREYILSSSPVRVRLTTEHPRWFMQVAVMPEYQEIIYLYDRLIGLQQRDLILQDWDSFCDTHDSLQQIFKKLVLEQVKYVCEYKIDTFFWKLLLYNVREYLKMENSPASLRLLPSLIEQSLRFYQQLFEELKTRYMMKNNTYELVARILAQRLLICLGDLCRYRVSYLQLNDFSETFKYYKQAQSLIPANGAPYNQLAIVAVHTHKRLDAVYYYIRSLLTSYAIQTAKESLLDLFDDMRKKFEETEAKNSPLHFNRCMQQHQKEQKSLRKEIWIYPDGARRVHRSHIKNSKNKMTVAEEHRYSKMTPQELLRHVISLYLYLLGKLYTGIGMENIYPYLRKLHIKMNASLKHRNLLSPCYILKMVALNIFVVEHNNKDSRREIRYHAFNFSNSIFGLMLQHANLLLESTLQQSTVSENFANEFMDLNTSLQFIRIYVHWLSMNLELWEPIRGEEHAFIDTWQELQILFCNIEKILDKNGAKCSLEQNKNNVHLMEDIFLNGFAPLGRAFMETMPLNTSATESTQFLVRIAKILDFRKCFVANEFLLQIPLETNFSFEELDVAMNRALSCLDDDKVSETKSPEEAVTPKDEETETSSPSEITQLTKLKQELEAQTKVKQLYNSKLEEILKFVDTKLYIEVRPRYLLPDTNCFIDCLEDFERLCGYTLIVPLTVVKELDGLSKGVKLDMMKGLGKKRIQHFDEVSSYAKKSLEFIKRGNSNNVRCVTTKGSIINPSLFALVEEEYASNDDKILATAMAVSKNLSTETHKDGKSFIQTELVLITTDRNLRVKALSRNLAVSALDEFLQWDRQSHGS